VFLGLVPDLTQVTFVERERTPPLSECLRKVASGGLKLGTPDGNANVGAALLRGGD
jgi:hypothetical protein